MYTKCISSLYRLGESKEIQQQIWWGKKAEWAQTNVACHSNTEVNLPHINDTNKSHAHARLRLTVCVCVYFAPFLVLFVGSVWLLSLFLSWKFRGLLSLHVAHIEIYSLVYARALHHQSTYKPSTSEVFFCFRGQKTYTEPQSKSENNKKPQY